MGRGLAAYEMLELLFSSHDDGSLFFEGKEWLTFGINLFERSFFPCYLSIKMANTNVYYQVVMLDRDGSSKFMCKLKNGRYRRINFNSIEKVAVIGYGGRRRGGVISLSGLYDVFSKFGVINVNRTAYRVNVSREEELYELPVMQQVLLFDREDQDNLGSFTTVYGSEYEGDIPPFMSLVEFIDKFK